MSKSKYYKLPAELINSGLTPRALILYAVLSDRAELSAKSGEKFTDKHGTYLIYPVAKLCEVLGVGDRTIRYALAELEDEGLIKTRKQGRTRPQKIYISDRQEIAAHDRQEIAAHNINTDNNNTDISSSTGEAGTERRIVSLISVIDKVAAKDNITLSDNQVYKLLKKIRKQGDKIGNLEGWIRTAVRNIIMLPDSDPDAEGYPPTYDIEEYESQSITDFMHSGENFDHT